MSAARPRETPSSAPQNERLLSGPRLVDGSPTPYASPARDLQSSLFNELEQAFEPETPRWPGALRLTIILGGAAGLWALVIAGARLVI